MSHGEKKPKTDNFKFKESNVVMLCVHVHTSGLQWLAVYIAECKRTVLVVIGNICIQVGSTKSAIGLNQKIEEWDLKPSTEMN